jgi:hypothetical protein
MPLFKSDVLKTKTVGKLKETVVKVTRQDNKMIEPSEVKKLVEDLMKEADKKYDSYKMRVRGLNVIQFFTLKGYADDEIIIKEVDDYLHGKVSNDAKFGKFYQLEITIIH